MRLLRVNDRYASTWTEGAYERLAERLPASIRESLADAKLFQVHFAYDADTHTAFWAFQNKAMFISFAVSRVSRDEARLIDAELPDAHSMTSSTVRAAVTRVIGPAQIF